MYLHDPLTPRQRWMRLAGGAGSVVGGFVLFHLSDRLDPDNRGAIVALALILFGVGWIGQAVRGHRETGIAREMGPLPGTPIAPARVAAGFVAAWLVPGLGHWMIGRRAKAALYFLTITLLFLTGALLAHGRNFNYDRDAVYFLAYAFNGLQTGLAWLLTKGLERSYEIRFYQLGFLYSSVASLLNLVAMMDFLATCQRVGREAVPAEAALEADVATTGEGEVR